MRSLLFLVAGLFAVANAADYVVDGSFEDVPESSMNVFGAKAGGWTLKNRAEFSDYPPDTPYGDVAVVCYRGKPSQSRCSASQQISGLDTSKSYTFAFSYRKYYTSPIDCTWTATLGSQTISSVLISKDEPDSLRQYKTSTKSFTPAQSSGTLTLQLVCGGVGQRGIYWEVWLDNISLTDAA